MNCFQINWFELKVTSKKMLKFIIVITNFRPMRKTKRGKQRLRIDNLPQLASLELNLAFLSPICRMVEETLGLVPLYIEYDDSISS